METRDDILNSALTLFANMGYDAVGVQSIVEAAGITKPTLYHYFGSKRGLFEALVRERSVAMLAVVREATDYQGDIKLSIQKTVKVYFEYAQRHPAFYRMLLSMWFAPPNSEYFASVRDVLYQEHALIEAMFSAAVRDYGNMRGRSKQYAVSLKGLIDTYIGMSFQGFVDLKADDLQYRIIHQFMHGIFS